VAQSRFTILFGLMLALALLGACSPLAPTATPTASGAISTPAAAISSAATVQSAPLALPETTPAPAAGTNAPKTLVPTPPADNSRPLAKVPAAQRLNAFSGPAPMVVTTTTHYVATIVTAKGNIVAELYQDTPLSDNNFVTLAEDGFYDGLTFHRVEPGFVIQGGDPAGDGTGGPGYTIPAEIKHTHIRGALAWARLPDNVNPKRDSSGSQFYIALADLPQLDDPTNGGYTVFGQVIQGLDVVDKIAVGDVIKEIDISQAAVSQLPTPPLPTPTRVPSSPSAKMTGRPLANLPVAQRENLYTMPPAMTINVNRTYQATIATAKGAIVLQLNPKAAPHAVNNFVTLANLGFYDGMPVADIQQGAFAVFGSPKSQEGSDVGYLLQPEATPTASNVITGSLTLYPVSSAQSQQWLESGSQFLIWIGGANGVQVPLTGFGKVIRGMDVADKLQAGDKVDTITITSK